MIDRAFFESQYLLYEDEVPVFETRSFQICRDILKTLNTFAFEYSKGMFWVRVERAKLLLRRHEISMTEIALRCGFSSGTHFSSCFAKNEGMSPTDYQAKYVD